MPHTSQARRRSAISLAALPGTRSGVHSRRRDEGIQWAADLKHKHFVVASVDLLVSENEKVWQLVTKGCSGDINNFWLGYEPHRKVLAEVSEERYPEHKK